MLLHDLTNPPELSHTDRTELTSGHPHPIALRLFYARNAA
ncbi:hypothetical protein ECSTECDG1313_2436 [Escherichia coli STEC_DG131-3]|nr:hypothetical protein ECSTECDG1313_2436 [Escherichia coli STEC_DG131-3]